MEIFNLIFLFCGYNLKLLAKKIEVPGSGKFATFKLESRMADSCLFFFNFFLLRIDPELKLFIYNGSRTGGAGRVPFNLSYSLTRSNLVNRHQKCS